MQADGPDDSPSGSEARMIPSRKAATIAGVATVLAVGIFAWVETRPPKPSTTMKLEHAPKTEAEAQAAKIYADSFGKDPGFYDFYRAMKSYEASFANPVTRGGTTIVLSPNNDYLRQFQGKK